jgi:large subunit ribosomal protein L11
MSVHALRQVRLTVPAAAAKPGPALGQALGPLGLNMAEFCKQFNERTKNYDKDVPIPVDLTGDFLFKFYAASFIDPYLLFTAYSNRTFTFNTKTPTVTYLVKKVVGIEKGAAK